jgi:hypothetical protein
MLNSNRITFILFALLLSFSSLAGTSYHYETTNIPCVGKDEAHPRQLIYVQSSIANRHDALQDVGKDDSVSVRKRHWLDCCKGLASSGGKCVDTSPKTVTPKKCSGNSLLCPKDKACTNSAALCPKGQGCFPANYEAYFYNEDENKETTEKEALEELASKNENKFLNTSSKNYLSQYWNHNQSNRDVSYCTQDANCQSYNCVRNPYYTAARLNKHYIPPAYSNMEHEKYRICLEQRVCRPALYQDKLVSGVECREGMKTDSAGECRYIEEIEKTPPVNPDISFLFDEKGCNINVDPGNFLTKLKRVRAFEWLIDAATLHDCHIDKVTGKSLLQHLKDGFLKSLVDGRIKAFSELEKTYLDIHARKKKLIGKKLNHIALVHELSEEQRKAADYDEDVQTANRILGMEMFGLIQDEQTAMIAYEQALMNSFIIADNHLKAAQEIWKGATDSKQKTCKRWNVWFKKKLRSNWRYRYKVWLPKPENSKAFDSVTQKYMGEMRDFQLTKRKSFLGIKGKTKFNLHDPLLPTNRVFKDYGGGGLSGKFRRRLYSSGDRLVVMRSDMEKRMRTRFASSNYVGDFELGLNKGCVVSGAHSPSFVDKLKFEAELPREHTVEEKALVATFCKNNPKDLTCIFKQKKVTCAESNKVYDEMMSLSFTQMILYSHGFNDRQTTGTGAAKYKLLESIRADLKFLIEHLKGLSGDRIKSLRPRMLACMDINYILPDMEYEKASLNKGMITGGKKYINKEVEKNWQRSKQSIIDCKNCNLSIEGGEIEIDFDKTNNVAIADAKWRQTLDKQDYSTSSTLLAKFEKGKAAYNKEMRALESRVRKKIGDSEYEKIQKGKLDAYNQLSRRLNQTAGQLKNDRLNNSGGNSLAAGSQGSADDAATLDKMKNNENDGLKAETISKAEFGKGSNRTSANVAATDAKGDAKAIAKADTNGKKGRGKDKDGEDGKDGEDFQKSIWGELYDDDTNDQTSYATHTGLNKEEIKQSLKSIDTKKRKNLLAKNDKDSLFQIISKTYLREGYKRVLVGPMYRNIKKQKEDFIDIGDRALKRDKTGVLNIKQSGLK